MSNKTSHTPGPWQASGSSLVNGFKVALSVRAGDSEVDTSAIARDIAAALNRHDEMLEALRRIIKAVDRGYQSATWKAVDEARAVLAKVDTK